jgi:hypothetical protein
VYEGNLAKIPGKHPRLEGTGDTSRVMKLGSLDEANAARGELEAIVRAWCEWRENGGTTPKRAPMTTASVKRPAKTAKRAPAPKPAPKHARAVKRR